ncbi:uncharacterized protein [Heterodontus francisci]|uniref:uncharacterized protein n=1 Tax=Heterodontus francisci TaxID=7792 RepID=UPI00355BDDB6
MELVVVSIPIEAFQKDLFGKKKGHSIDALLEDIRKYEAIVAGQQHLQALGAVNSIDTITRLKKASTLCCGKCGLSHSRQNCLAFRDLCKACGVKGHWACLCRNSCSDYTARNNSRTQANRRQAQQHCNSSKESARDLYKQKPIHEVQSKPDLGQDPKMNKSQSEDEQAFHIVNLTHHVGKVQQLEAFTTITITHPKKSGKHTLKVKINTGASANILPVRISKICTGVAEDR